MLQDEVIKKLKTGKTAMFIIFDTPEAGIGIPISLQGFGDALSTSEIGTKRVDGRVYRRPSIRRGTDSRLARAGLSG